MKMRKEKLGGINESGVEIGICSKKESREKEEMREISKASEKRKLKYQLKAWQQYDAKKRRRIWTSAAGVAPKSA